jgi:hypothetical protein
MLLLLLLRFDAAAKLLRLLLTLTLMRIQMSLFSFIKNRNACR